VDAAGDGPGAGGDSGGASSEGGSAGDGSALGPYPSGPYCAPAGTAGHLATGCILQPMTWIGYVDDAADAVATTKPYVSYSLDDVRHSGKRYAMINVAEFDCPGCQQSAMDLETGGASVVHAGGVVIEVLMTSGFVAIASQANLQSWVGKYQLPVTSLKDPDSSPTTADPTPTNTYFGRRDQAYIIEIPSMKVLQYIDGSIVAVPGGNSATQAMAAMHTLLGK
jgi:hypothetical protein